MNDKTLKMVSGNPADQNKLTQKQPAYIPGAQSNVSTGNELDQFNRAFGFISNNSSASSFAAAIKKQAEENSDLRQFYCGAVKQLDNQLGSVAYVGVKYEDSILYGAILFERGDSLILREDINNPNTQTYTTLTSLFNSAAKAVVDAQIKADYNLASNPIYVTLNSIPDTGDTMTPERATKIMGQLLSLIYGRIPGRLGKLVVNREHKFNVTIGSVPPGMQVIDVNGMPQRADFQIRVVDQPNNTDSYAPTLLNNNEGGAYPEVDGVGYVNLRYNGVSYNADKTLNLQQINPEIVATLIDSSKTSAEAPLERQLVALIPYAIMAQRGGWKNYVLANLNKTHKLSALAQNLEWNDKVTNVKKVDENVEAQSACLDFFCTPTASLVVSHRSGNGIGGLAALLSEVASNNPQVASGATKVLLNILDGMFPADPDKGLVTFRDSLATAFKLNHSGEINSRHIIGGVVPTICGRYRSENGYRSFDDMDLITVCNYLGDRRADVINYFKAQSYAYRNMDPKTLRIFLVQTARTIFAAGQPSVTGEGYNMAINPTFAETLVSTFTARGYMPINGLGENNQISTTPFINTTGTNFTLSGGNGSTINDSYGFMGGLSGYYNL